jgi:hypothetical protein
MVDNSLPLERVITTAELSRRASRSPDYELESRALAAVMAAMADQPNADSVLQKLVDELLQSAHLPPAASLSNWSGT